MLLAMPYAAGPKMAGVKFENYDLLSKTVGGAGN